MFRSFDFSLPFLIVFSRMFSGLGPSPQLDLDSSIPFKIQKSFPYLPAPLLDSPSSFPDAHSFLVDSMVLFLFPLQVGRNFHLSIHCYFLVALEPQTLVFLAFLPVCVSFPFLSTAVGSQRQGPCLNSLAAR